MTPRKLIFIFINTMSLLVYTLSLIAQNSSTSYPYTQWTVSTGLAQMQIRDILIDDQNYVWIATQGGLNGYDGTRLHSYSLGPISEQYIIKLVHSKDGLYGMTPSCVFYFDGSIVKNITPHFNFDLTNMNLLFEDSNGVLWFESGGKLFDIESGSLEPIECIYPKLQGIECKHGWGDPTWNTYYILTRENKLISFSPTSGKTLVDSTTFKATDNISYTIYGHSSKLEEIYFYKSSNHRFEQIYNIENDHLNLVASISGENDLVVKRSTHAPTAYVDEIAGKSTLFILQDLFYRAVKLEVNHIRFCCSLGNKVFVGSDDGFIVVHLDGLENINLNGLIYPWSVIPIKNDNVFVSTYKSGYYHLNEHAEIVNAYPFPNSKIDSNTEAQFLSNYLVNDGTILMGSACGFYYLKDESGPLQHFNMARSVEAFAFDSVRNAYLVGSDKLYWIDRNITKVVDSMELDHRLQAFQGINDIAIGKDSSIWIASSLGIQKYSVRLKKSTTFIYSDGSLSCLGGVCLEVDSTNQLWVGATCGLLLYNADKSTFEKVLPDLIYERVNQLITRASNQLICVTNKNLFVIDISKSIPEVQAIFSSENGLKLWEPSENGICITENRFVWLPSVNGIQRLDLDKLIKPGVTAHIKILSVNDVPVSFNGVHNAYIRVAGPSALVLASLINHRGGIWKYSYSLNGSEYSIAQSGTELLVHGLSHGQNFINIKACPTYSQSSKCVETTLEIIATLPWIYRSSTRYAALFISLILVGLLIVSYRKEQHKKSQLSSLKLDLLKNRLRTIQTYLNPHFLFNTLTTIQDYILHKDRNEGSDMIVRLSRIFRHVLNFGNSEKKIGTVPVDLIKLSEEISLIKDIVYLQNLQQSHPVAFHLDLPENIEIESIFIPPLLIQPFIENAYKHAFGDKESVRQIDLKFEMDSQYLIIWIRDTGRGFSNSSDSPYSNNIGLKLAKERMDILNALHIENDITIVNNVPQGTEVKITIKRIQ